jgi:multiple sugar transport system substrate-binding protein
MQAVTIDGKVYAAIFRMDLGLLYYRTDIATIPPATWQDLTTIAQKAIADKKVENGYVWQGGVGTHRDKSKYGEGLFCDYLEVLYAYNGRLNLNDLSTVTSPEAISALAEMAGWVDTISPAEVIQDDEDPSFDTWAKGSTAFMRNWPTYYILSENSRPLMGKFNVAPLPYQAGRGLTTGASCLGGWCLAINAASSPAKQGAAWLFIHWMMGEEAQLYAAKVNAWLTTLMSVYDNPDILTAYPFFNKISDMLTSAIVRPQSPFYIQISDLFQTHIHQALQNVVTPMVALNELKNDLDALFKKEQKSGLALENALTACHTSSS